MKFVCVLFCALFPSALAAPPPPSPSRASAAPPISVKSSQFVDVFGRQRIFHGINIVAKEFPWIDPVFQNASFAPFIQSIGVNVVRLGWMWSGFEPEEGKFNMTYYAQVRAAADSLAAHGIYVILDAHQDILSSKFCLYDGFPLWVINKSSPAHAFPWPLRGDCSRPWGENAFSEAAGQAYQDFYDNHAGMRDAFVRFWTFSAQLWSDCDSVLGFELINEPFAGAVLQYPDLLLPGVAGSRNLQPLYDAVGAAMRHVDQRHIIFYEPVTWGMVEDGRLLGSGLSAVPGGAHWSNLSCLSYHFYCRSFGSSRSVCDGVVEPSMFRSMKDEVEKLGGASMMTEWGGNDCGGSEEQQAECSFVQGVADQHLQSWTLWGMNSHGIANGSFTPQQAEVLSRTYAQAVAGSVVNMTFQQKSRAFELCFEMDSSIAEPTVIYIAAAAFYKDSPDISTTPNVIAHLSGNSVLVTPASFDTAPLTPLACVRITPPASRALEMD